MKKKIMILAVICFMIDQISKLLVAKYVTYKSVIPGLLYLIYAKNTGVAFSMLSDNTIFIVLISLVLILYIIHDLRKQEKIDNSLVLIYGLLFGGIFGNLFDRVFRGYVIDFISLKFHSYSFAIFNVADIMITIAVVLLLIKILTRKEEKTSDKDNDNDK